MNRDCWLVVTGCTSNNCFVCLAVDAEDPGNVKEPGRARHATDWHASNASAVDGVEIGTCGAARGVSQQTCLVPSYCFWRPLTANDFAALQGLMNQSPPRKVMTVFALSQLHGSWK